MKLLDLEQKVTLNQEEDFQQQQAKQRFEERINERKKNESNLLENTPYQVETPERVSYRKKLIDPRDGMALERLIGDNDLFPINYLEAGQRAGMPVCRIEVRDKIGRVIGHGTGFLVSPSLLLTNNHVLERENQALSSIAQFNYELDSSGKEKPIISFRFDPNRLFVTNKKLDYTLVAVESSASDGNSLSNFGYLPLDPHPGKILIGEYVSVIQHPSGAPKAIAIRENKVIDVFDDYVHYLTDTLRGSSGSPVYNDEWMVVALHHAGVPSTDKPDEFIANEGIRISSILKDVTDIQNLSSPEQKQLIEELISLYQNTETIPPEQEEIEELSLEWYEGSTGYDASFLGNGYDVPLPTLRSDLQSDVAPLKNGEELLKYTHFSIMMSKSRRLAYYTAVNIDGKQSQELPRPNKWRFDPRMEEEYQIGNNLYKGSPLNKGHLVRRLDPVWGSNSNEANIDTFHFTNASPQHGKLNQKTWLELENYILNSAITYRMMVTVFTGPILRPDDIVYRGVRIPEEFWKVVAIVKTDGKLSATAYKQSQKHLIGNLEFEYGECKTYQVFITDIEALTGLDFGELREHDPLKKITDESFMAHVVEKEEDIIL